MSVKTWSLALLVALVANLAAAKQVYNSDGVISIHIADSAVTPGREVLTFLWSPTLPMARSLHGALARCMRSDAAGSNPVSVRSVVLEGTESGKEVRLRPADLKMRGGLAEYVWDLTAVARTRFAHDPSVAVAADLSVGGKAPRQVAVQCEFTVFEVLDGVELFTSTSEARLELFQELLPQIRSSGDELAAGAAPR